MFLNIEKNAPDSVAVKDDSGAILTYEELINFAEELKNILPQRVLVFCLCDNDCGSFAGYYGLYENKAVSLLLDSKIDKNLLNSLIETYSPQFLWCSEDYCIKNCAENYNSSAIISFGNYKLIQINKSSPRLNENLSFLLTTSGSTGNPKLVRHKYGNLEHNARVVAEVFNWTTEEKGMCQLPMHYTMGLNVINSLIYAGATVLLSKNNLMSKPFWEFFKTEKATSFTGVPYSYEIMLKMKLLKMDLPYFKTLASGGGKLSDENFVKLAEYANDTDRKFFATFGTTETSARLAYLPPEFATEKINSIGKAFPGGELFLIDDDGEIITEMETEGELVYCGKNVTMGYAVKLADLALGDEWKDIYKTGDIAKRDSDGFYYIIGRKTRFLKLFGHRIGLDYCENLVSEKFTTECACTGTDKQMLIFITNHDIVDNVSEYLTEITKFPRNAFNVNFISEFPRKSSGKIDYIQLIKST